MDAPRSDSDSFVVKRRHKPLTTVFFFYKEEMKHDKLYLVANFNYLMVSIHCCMQNHSVTTIYSIKIT